MCLLLIADSLERMLSLASFCCRYLVISQPMWYRFRRNIKTSVVVCCVVWMLPMIYVFPLHLIANPKVTDIIVSVYLLFPLPLFIFFLGGTIRTLSAARSVSADEKRRIVAILVVVLLIYILLFLPSVILLLVEQSRNYIFNRVVYVLLNLSPLADLSIYIFIRKGAIDKLLVSICCCKMNNSRQTTSMNYASSSQTL